MQGRGDTESKLVWSQTRQNNATSIETLVAEMFWKKLVYSRKRSALLFFLYGVFQPW